MKRGLLVILAVLFLFVILSSEVFAVQTTGSAVQTVGKVTTSPVSASIYIQNAPPVINYLIPREGRLYRGQNFMINYSAYDPDGISMVFYGLNDSANVSIGNASTNFTYINVSEGYYYFHFYVNDTLGGLNLSSFYIIINDSRLVVIYETFRTDGTNSTNFDSLNQAQLENLSNMVLENISNGKILWTSPVNLSNDTIPGDGFTIIDYNVIINNGSIFVNTTNLSNIDKSARLWFYNLSYTNPRVLKDGVVCPESVCSNKLYSLGTLQVDVTGLSNYSLEETPEESPGAMPSGGGTSKKEVAEKNFFLDKEEIIISLKQGEIKSDSFVIINNRGANISISLVPIAIGDFLKIEEREFSLGAGEIKKIRLDFIAPEDKKPNFYMGKLSVISGNTRRDILIAIEIESKGPLFDVSVEIPKASQSVFPGESVISFIKIYSLGESRKVDALIEYSLMDSMGEVISLDHETVAVETRASLIKEIEVPETAKSGNYFIYAKVMYNNQSASSSAKFFVKKRSFFQTGTFIYALLIAILVLLTAIFIVIYLELKSRSRAKGEKIIDERILASKNQVKFKEGKKKPTWVIKR